ncbi:MAG: UDP-glucose/GDP-mannose dehydrogenase family protein [Candidatus Eisenbacteria bacterium]|nr:UDP-glucose/GDP-mannose dehydrogenase family protein [Candidatus Eisenbacteria bacterium]
MSKICVIGTGYVGLVTGACFADFGHQVTCVDSNPERLDQLRRLHMPFYEPGMEELVAKNVRQGRLSFTGDLGRAVRETDFVFIAVGTPQGRSGATDLGFVFTVAKQIAPHLTGYKVIVQKSTVPPGTGRKLAELVRQHLKRGSKARFDVVSNPEFLREGAAVDTFMHTDRIVIGADSQKALKAVAGLYRPLYLIETPMVLTNLETSELIKYAANNALATKISFINEMSRVCEAIGPHVDVNVVAKAVGLDKRIGSKFLHAGPGFGGSCFPKDCASLLHFSKQFGAPTPLTGAVMKVNRDQRRFVYDKILAGLGSPRGKTVALLGLAFKPNTDDLRESVGMDFGRWLLRAGIKVKAYDPIAMPGAQQELPGLTYCPDAYTAARGADVLVVVTEWNQFRELDLGKLKRIMRRPAIVDCRNIYDPRTVREIGFRYQGVGRGEA